MHGDRPPPRVGGHGSEHPASVAFSLHPVAPFRLDLTVWALRRRPRNLFDAWEAGRYRRALVVDGRPLSIEVSQSEGVAPAVLTMNVTGWRLDLTEGRVAAARRVVESTLGLEIDLTGFYELASRDRRLAELVARYRGVKPPRFPSLFESLANAVACQQLSLEVGIELLNRLTKTYGLVAPGPARPLAAFPEPAAVADLAPAALRQLGFSTQKARTLIRLAAAIADGELDVRRLEVLSRTQSAAALQSLSGIGRWSAEYVLLRGLGRLEVYPGDDVGARNKLRSFLDLPVAPDYAAIRDITAAWDPFAGMLYFHLLLQGLASRGVLPAGRRFAEVDPA